MAIVNTHYGFCGAQKLPELAGTWALNERLYPPENNIYIDGVNFNVKNSPTVGGSTATGFEIKTINGAKRMALQLKPSGTWFNNYNFDNNTWENYYKYFTFEDTTGFSDEFHVWLASNATKLS